MVSLFSRFAFSCSCFEPKDIDFLIAKASTVQIAFIDSALVADDNVIASASRISVIKGNPVFRFHTPLAAPMCGMSVSVGREYWLFIDEYGEVNRCDGSVELGNVSAIPISRLFIQLLEERRREDWGLRRQDNEPVIK
jgi:hypothetical protein